MTANDASADARTTASIQFTQNGHEFDVMGYEGDHIFETIRRGSDFYERVLLDALAPFVPAGGVVLDVGANLGNHTLYFAGVCEARVMAFEAFAPTASLLERNVGESGVADLVDVRRTAVGRERGRVAPAAVDWSNVGSTRFVPSDSGVEVVTLDDLSMEARVDLLKIDVEGMDVDVIEGARALIERDRPVLSCEASAPEEIARLDAVVADIGYSYLARYNATSTWVLLPARTDVEKVALQRHLITGTSMSNMAFRDLYYRVRLANEAIDSLR